MMRTGWRVALLAVLLGLSVVACYQGRAGDAPDEITVRFEQAYADWVKYIAAPDVLIHSDDAAYISNEPFRRMVGLGPPAFRC